ncbi:hypothetical protein, partial [Candidatus Symbiothrix dinenymphae]|uniref:hypothetical protein n=1 Tax=Candidatus Symbiothrix dinenymphae TaxID=467085 RepID=UPI00131580D1
MNKQNVFAFFPNSVEHGSYKDHKIAEIEIEKSPSLNKGFDTLQQDSDLLIAIPEIRNAFECKGTTNNLNNQTAMGNHQIY